MARPKSTIAQREAKRLATTLLLAVEDGAHVSREQMHVHFADAIERALAAERRRLRREIHSPRCARGCFAKGESR